MKYRFVAYLLGMFAVAALSGCAQPTALNAVPTMQWWQSTSMTPDAQVYGSKKPGIVSQTHTAVRYVFLKTPECRVEPKALNAFAHLSIGQWILRKTSPCYETHEGQLLQVNMDSGRVVRIEQFDQPALAVGQRVWVQGDRVFAIAAQETQVPVCTDSSSTHAR